MPGELMRYLFGGADDRQQRRELEHISHTAELADLQVAAVGHVTKRAMVETMQTGLVRREAERLAPDGAELYAMIMVAGAIEMTTVISKMNRPGGYKR